MLADVFYNSGREKVEKVENGKNVIRWGGEDRRQDMMVGEVNNEEEMRMMRRRQERMDGDENDEEEIEKEGRR